MASLEKQYATCNGAYLNFYDGHNSGTSLLTPDVSFLAFLTEFSQNYSLTYDQEEVFGRNDPIMTYRSTKRTLSLAWDLPANDLFEANSNKIKTRILMRLLYPEYRNNYIVRKTADLTKSEKQKLESMRKQGYVGFAALENFETPYGDSFQEYMALISSVALNNFSNVATIIDNGPENTWGAPDNFQYEFSGLKHTQTMIKNPLVAIKYANLITATPPNHSNFVDTGEPLLGWIDNLSITPQLDAGFFTQKPGVLADLIPKEQLNKIGKKRAQALKTVEQGGSFPKVYSLSCNFNVVHQKRMGWNGVTGGFSDFY